MRFIHLYLVGYFVLVVGAGLALWQAGVLAACPAIWLAIAPSSSSASASCSPSLAADAHNHSRIRPDARSADRSDPLARPDRWHALWF